MRVCVYVREREYEMNMRKDICGNMLNEHHDMHVP